MNELILKKISKETPLLQILLEAQSSSKDHYLSSEDIGIIAKELGVPRCRVYSTASFYSEISLKPRGKNIIRVCSNSPCENAGTEKIQQELKKLLKIDIGETTPDKKFTIETVNCLGSCYISPAIKINDTVYGDLKPEKIKSILDSYLKEGE
ncbi:MAG: NAD(P)H-dependent oxidoreductase subunit E [Fusobacteriaceae bacterium]